MCENFEGSTNNKKIHVIKSFVTINNDEKKEHDIMDEEQPLQKDSSLLHCSLKKQKNEDIYLDDIKNINHLEANFYNNSKSGEVNIENEDANVELTAKSKPCNCFPMPCFSISSKFLQNRFLNKKGKSSTNNQDSYKLECEKNATISAISEERINDVKLYKVFNGVEKNTIEKFSKPFKSICLLSSSLGHQISQKIPNTQKNNQLELNLANEIEQNKKPNNCCELPLDFRNLVSLEKNKILLKENKSFNTKVTNAIDEKDFENLNELNNPTSPKNMNPILNDKELKDSKSKECRSNFCLPNLNTSAFKLESKRLCFNEESSLDSIDGLLLSNQSIFSSATIESNGTSVGLNQTQSSNNNATNGKNEGEEIYSTNPLKIYSIDATPKIIHEKSKYNNVITFGTGSCLGYDNMEKEIKSTLPYEIKNTNLPTSYNTNINEKSDDDNNNNKNMHLLESNLEKFESQLYLDTLCTPKCKNSNNVMIKEINSNKMLCCPSSLCSNKDSQQLMSNQLENETNITSFDIKQFENSQELNPNLEKVELEIFVTNLEDSKEKVLKNSKEKNVEKGDCICLSICSSTALNFECDSSNLVNRNGCVDLCGTNIHDDHAKYNVPLSMDQNKNIFGWLQNSTNNKLCDEFLDQIKKEGKIIQHIHNFFLILCCLYSNKY